MKMMQTNKYFENDRLVFVFLFGVTLICYFNAIFMDFVWDDISHLTEFAKFIRRFPDLLVFFKTTNIVGQKMYYRPLMLISFGIDYLIFKQHPFGYHITSIILHIINVFLVFLVTERIVNRKVAFMSAVLFTIHPVHSEPVVWISARADVLAASFSFASIYFYLGYIDKHRWHTFLLTALFFALAVFTKETSIMLLLLFSSYPFFKKSPFNRHDFLLLMLNLVITLVYLFIRGMVVGGFIIDYYPLQAKLATIPLIFVSYLKLFFFPVDLHLLYAEPKVLPYPNIETVYAVIIIVIFTGFFFYIVKKWRETAFFLFFYILFLLPVSGIVTFVRVSIIADRYLYLPSYGLTVLCCICVYRIYQKLNGEKLKFALIVVSVLVSTSLLIMTINRNKLWSNNKDFLKEMIADMPDYDGAYLQLGVIYLVEKNFEEAEKMYSLALKYANGEDKALALNNLCYLFRAMGRLEKAEEFCLKSLLYSKSSKAYINLAEIYIQQKDYPKAYDMIINALAIENRQHHFFNIASFVASKLGRMDEALYYIDRAIELAPNQDILLRYQQNKQLILLSQGKSPKRRSNE